MTTRKSVSNHIKWAFEALVNYATYRVQGDAPGVVMPEKEDSPDWPKDQVPILEDLWESEPEFDFEYGDYLLVRACIAKHVSQFPQDHCIADFLTHCLYHRKAVGEFYLFVPFGNVKVSMASLHKTYAHNAWRSVSQLLKLVASEKQKSEGGLDNL